MTRSVPDLIRPDWSAPVHIGACFTTRVGGWSRAPFDSLNLGLHCGDQVESVQRNRLLITSALDLDRPPVWLQQVHGARCLQLPSANDDLRADAAWTNQAGVCCAVLTADCLPVLITDVDGTLVAAIHAGWRGLATGVIGACIAQLPVPTQDLLAWLGPAIGAANYEVDTSIIEAFTDRQPEAASCFEASRENHWQADLTRLARQQLKRLGVTKFPVGTTALRLSPNDFSPIAAIREPAAWLP